MTSLVLLRHAEAVKNEGGGDHARALSGAGREAAAAAGRRLRALLPSDAEVIASDAHRTRQTAELAFPEQVPSNLRLEPALYAATAGDLLTVVRDLSDHRSAAVLVGHNPGISELASLLAGGGDPAGLARLAEGLATADAVVLAFDTAWRAVGPKTGRLVALVGRADAES